MQQIFAKVKRNSKYYYQNESAKKNGEFPFAVNIIKARDGYDVNGGPGGQYRLSDVNLFVIASEREIRIR